MPIPPASVVRRAGVDPATEERDVGAGEGGRRAGHATAADACSGGDLAIEVTVRGVAGFDQLQVRLLAAVHVHDVGVGLIGLQDQPLGGRATVVTTGPGTGPGAVVREDAEDVLREADGRRWGRAAGEVTRLNAAV